MKLHLITIVPTVCIIISALVEAQNTTTTKGPTTKATKTKTKDTSTAITTTKIPTKTTKEPTTTTKNPTTTTRKPTTTTRKPTTTTKKPTTTTRKPSTTTKKPTNTTKKPTTTTKKPTTATTKPTTTKPSTSTTKKPTTTTKKPTTATTKPTTTKPPTSTTKKPTTTTKKPTTAATKPTTTKPTTTLKPGTTAQPTATPSPYDLDLDVTKGGIKCLMLEGQISLKVKEEVIDLNRKGCRTVSGKCSPMKQNNETSEIKANCVIGSNTNSDINVNITIAFTGGDMWYLSSIKVDVVNNMTAHATATYGSSANGKLFQAQSNHSYTCANDHALLLIGADNNVTIDFKKISIQPFALQGKEYVNPVACPSGVTPSPDSSIVPIAVGCALAGLIVIVLIAYLIGRRQNAEGRRKSYQEF